MNKQAEAKVAECTRDALLLVSTRGTSAAADERFQRDAAETIERLCEDVEYIVEEHEDDLERRVDKCAEYVESVLDPISPDLFECALFLRDFATLMEGVRQWRVQEAYRSRTAQFNRPNRQGYDVVKPRPSRKGRKATARVR